MSEKIVQLNEEVIRGQIKGPVCCSVEEAPINYTSPASLYAGWRILRKLFGAARNLRPLSASETRRRMPVLRIGVIVLCRAVNIHMSKWAA